MTLKLREFRKSTGLSQPAIAKGLTRSWRAYQAWERGETSPTADSLVELCELYGCDPNTLMGWYDEHPEQPGEYSDARQAALNAAYVCLSDDGKAEAVKAVERLSYVPGLSANAPPPPAIPANGKLVLLMVGASNVRRHSWRVSPSVRPLAA